MTFTEAVLFVLATIWVPGLMLIAYLVWGPRRTVDPPVDQANPSTSIHS